MRWAIRGTEIPALESKQQLLIDIDDNPSEQEERKNPSKGTHDLTLWDLIWALHPHSKASTAFSIFAQFFFSFDISSTTAGHDISCSDLPTYCLTSSSFEAQGNNDAESISKIGWRKEWIGLYHEGLFKGNCQNVSWREKCRIRSIFVLSHIYVVVYEDT